MSVCFWKGSTVKWCGQKTTNTNTPASAIIRIHLATHPLRWFWLKITSLHSFCLSLFRNFPFKPTLLLLESCFIGIILPSYAPTRCSVGLYTRWAEPSRLQDLELMVRGKVRLKTTTILAARAPDSCRPLHQQPRRSKAMIYIGKHTGGSYITRVCQSTICTGDITRVPLQLWYTLANTREVIILPGFASQPCWVPMLSWKQLRS